MPDPDAQARAPLILLGTAQEWLARSLETVLAPRGYRVLKVYTARSVLDTATKMAPDAVVLDLELPESDGLSVCRALRAEGRVSECTPILLTTTGPATRQQRLEVLRAGAADLQSQPMDPDEFMLRLEAHLRYKLAAERFRNEGLIDSRSGLYNLTGLLRRAGEVQADAARRGLSTVCVAFAPDATYANGDRLAQAFRKHGRASDVIARLNGAEFAVVASGADGGATVRLTERMTRALEREVGPAVHLAAGYHSVRPERDDRIEPMALVEAARAALRSVLTKRA